MIKATVTLLTCLSACGDKRTTSDPPSDPGPGSEFIVQHRASVSTLMNPWLPSTEPVDIQSAGPVKFERVKIVPIAEGKADAIHPVAGVFAVQFTPVVVDATALDQLQTRALCRIGTRTHAIVDFRGPYKPDGKEISATINIQPYTDAPSVCQLDWFGAATADAYPTTPLASACFRRATRDIVSGRCPAEALPPMPMPAGATAMLEVLPDTLKLESGSFAFNGVVTAGADVPATQTWRTVVRCDDGKALRETYPASDTLPKQMLLLPPGASMFVMHGAFFKKDGDVDARCELRLTTGTKVRATYCVGGGEASGVLTPGACSPGLRAK